MIQGSQDFALLAIDAQGRTEKVDDKGWVRIRLETKERTAVDLPEPFSHVIRPMPCSLIRKSDEHPVVSGYACVRSIGVGCLLKMGHG
jgi:hypothetical protein